MFGECGWYPQEKSEELPPPNETSLNHRDIQVFWRLGLWLLLLKRYTSNTIPIFRQMMKVAFWGKLGDTAKCKKLWGSVAPIFVKNVCGSVFYQRKRGERHVRKFDALWISGLTLSNPWLFTADRQHCWCGFFQLPQNLLANFDLNSYFLTVLQINWKLLISFFLGIVKWRHWPSSSSSQRFFLGVTWVPTGLKNLNSMDPWKWAAQS